MQRIMILLFLFGISTSLLTAQTAHFKNAGTPNKGPFIEVADEGYNVYTWYKKSGFKSKNASSKNNVPVTWSSLEVKSISTTGEIKSTDNYNVRLKNVGDGFEKYEVTDMEKIGKLNDMKVIAQYSDPTYDQLIDRFPNSLAHSEGELYENNSDNIAVGKVRGKGLMGGKKPYTLSFENSASDGEFELDDFPTNDPKAEWKSGGSTVNADGGASISMVPVWYSKWIKKDRFNHFKEFKLVCYNDQGKVANELDLNFTKPNKIYETTQVFNMNGEKEGKIYSFGELYGMGYKKVNPDPDKKGNTLIYVSRDGKTIDQIYFEARTDRWGSGAPDIIAAQKTSDGIHFYTHTNKKKKENIEMGMDEYLITGKECKMVKTHDYKDLVKHSSGKHITHNFVKKMNILNYDVQFKLESGGTLYITNAKTKTTENKIIYDDCKYLTTNADGSLKQFGKIEIGNVNTGNRPNLKILKLDSGRALITIDHKNLTDVYWVFDETGNFEAVKPQISTLKSMQRGNTIYFYGTKNEEKTAWFIEKITL